MSSSVLPGDLPLTLDISASVKYYGNIPDETRRLYGWSLILEAGKEVSLRVHNASHGAGVGYDWLVAQHDGPVLANVSHGPPVVRLNCTRPGVGVSVRVVETGPQGVKRLYQTDSAVCKYVRREVRELSKPDLERYLEALRVFYSEDLQQGRAKYGQHFVNNHFVTAVHNSHKWCLHSPNQFLGE
jgi:hypothetical protein